MTDIMIGNQGVELEHFLEWLLEKKLGSSPEEYLTFKEEEKLLKEKKKLNYRLESIEHDLEWVEKENKRHTRKLNNESAGKEG